MPQVRFKTKPEQIPCAGRGREGRVCVSGGQDAHRTREQWKLQSQQGSVNSAGLPPRYLSPALGMQRGMVPVPAPQPCIPTAWKSSTHLPTPCPQLSGTRGPRDPLPSPLLGSHLPPFLLHRVLCIPQSQSRAWNTEGALLGYTQLAINLPRALGAEKREPTEQKHSPDAVR